MAVQYLLPCDCGNTTPIDTNQAGSTVSCKCGKNLEVPSLRAIRQLTPLDQGDVAREYQWNLVAGLTFASGVVIALVGASVAYYMFVNTKELKQFQPPPREAVDAWVEEADIDNAPPDELMEMWDSAVNIGLGEYRVSHLVQARETLQWVEMYMNIGLIVVVCGLAFAGSSFFLRNRVN